MSLYTNYHLKTYRLSLATEHVEPTAHRFRCFLMGRPRAIARETGGGALLEQILGRGQKVLINALVFWVVLGLHGFGDEIGPFGGFIKSFGFSRAVVADGSRFESRELELDGFCSILEVARVEAVGGGRYGDGSGGQMGL